MFKKTVLFFAAAIACCGVMTACTQGNPDDNKDPETVNSLWEFSALSTVVPEVREVIFVFGQREYRRNLF